MIIKCRPKHQKSILNIKERNGEEIKKEQDEHSTRNDKKPSAELCPQTFSSMKTKGSDEKERRGDWSRRERSKEEARCLGRSLERMAREISVSFLVSLDFPVLYTLDTWSWIRLTGGDVSIVILSFSFLVPSFRSGSSTLDPSFGVSVPCLSVSSKDSTVYQYPTRLHYLAHPALGSEDCWL